ncbi:TetR/AcrR family transcriptional regulator [Pseudooceanicola sp. LIPI14-2-Ac024]|uniref:TetR/AcrR family transcriptional regulator n=1 Tax=Pseudooceanicola sp. LIPI14-2-Ac024 TaxID=3344875 RepID=UPI0035CF0FC6
MQEARRKPRADALRNRSKLIDAAKEILGRGGPEASLEAVAREAGVGIATLYRNFPTREDLFHAVYAHEAEHLVELAQQLSGQDDKLGALRDWVHALIDVVATKRGMLGTLAMVPTDESKAMFAAQGGRMKEAGAALLAAAVESGSVRPDITGDELMSTIYGLCYAQPAQPGWQDKVLKLIDIFLDGLRRG